MNIQESSDSLNEQLRICRQCHTIYKSSSQKFCGNGCERKPPFFCDGQKITNIEEREVKIPTTKETEIRWVCISCKREYNTEELKEKKWICNCGVSNDFYPFTIKSCGNIQCKKENQSHNLPLNAKVCDLCGKINFILNNNKNSPDLKPRNEKKSNQWESLEEYHFPSKKAKIEGQSDILSLNFSILSNNLENHIFGHNLEITMKDMLQNAKGYIPESIYSKYIKKYGYDRSIFCIKFIENQENFIYQSEIETEILEIKPDSPEKRQGSIINIGNQLVLKENDFVLLKADFFKIRIWVY